MKGGKRTAKEVQAFIRASYKDKPPNQIDDWILDKKLSVDTALVYYNPKTNEAVVAHRGTKGAKDWANNAAWLSGLYTFTPRYNKGLTTQKKAEKKYGAKNVSTIAHSQGSIIARKVGKNSKRIINLNPAFKGERPLENEYNIRSSADVVSGLLPAFQYLRGSDRDITIPSASKDLFKEHTSEILDRLENTEIGGNRQNNLLTNNIMNRRQKQLGYTFEEIDWFNNKLRNDVAHSNCGTNPRGVIGGSLTPSEIGAVAGLGGITVLLTYLLNEIRNAIRNGQVRPEEFPAIRHFVNQLNGNNIGEANAELVQDIEEGIQIADPGTIEPVPIPFIDNLPPAISSIPAQLPETSQVFNLGDNDDISVEGEAEEIQRAVPTGGRRKTKTEGSVAKMKGGALTIEDIAGLAVAGMSVPAILGFLRAYLNQRQEDARVYIDANPVPATPQLTPENSFNEVLPFNEGDDVELFDIEAQPTGGRRKNPFRKLTKAFDTAGRALDKGMATASRGLSKVNPMSVAIKDKKTREAMAKSGEISNDYIIPAVVEAGKPIYDATAMTASTMLTGNPVLGKAVADTLWKETVEKPGVDPRKRQKSKQLGQASGTLGKLMAKPYKAKMMGKGIPTKAFYGTQMVPSTLKTKKMKGGKFDKRQDKEHSKNEKEKEQAREAFIRTIPVPQEELADVFQGFQAPQPRMRGRGRLSIFEKLYDIVNPPVSFEDWRERHKNRILNKAEKQYINDTYEAMKLREKADYLDHLAKVTKKNREKAAKQYGVFEDISPEEAERASMEVEDKGSRRMKREAQIAETDPDWAMEPELFLKGKGRKLKGGIRTDQLNNFLQLGMSLIERASRAYQNLVSLGEWNETTEDHEAYLTHFINNLAPFLINSASQSFQEGNISQAQGFIEHLQDEADENLPQIEGDIADLREAKLVKEDINKDTDSKKGAGRKRNKK